MGGFGQPGRCISLFQAPVHQQYWDVGCGVEDGGGAAAGLSLLGQGGVGFGGAGCSGLLGTQAKSFSRVRPDARGRWAGAAQGAGRGRAVSGAAGRGVSVRVVVVERVGAAARGRQSRRRSAGPFSRGAMHSPPQRPGQPCGASTPSLRKGVLESWTWGNRPTALPSPSSA